MDNLNDIINNGNIDDINKMLENGAIIDNESLDIAINTKDINIVKLIIKNGGQISINSLNLAIDTEKLEIINIIIEGGAIIDYNTFIKIINKRNIDIIKLFLNILDSNFSLKTSIDANIIYHVLNTHDLNIIYIFLRSGFYNDDILYNEINYLNKHKHIDLEILRLILHYHYKPIEFDLFKGVLLSTNIDVIKIFLEKDINIIQKDYDDNYYDIEHLIYFIHSMNLEALLSKEIYKLIIKRFINIIDINTLNTLIKLNNLEIIKIILDNDIKPNYKSLIYAIELKNINMIELFLVYIETNTFTLNNAINTGDIDIITYFLNKGIKPDITSLNNTIGIKNLNLIKKIIFDGNVKPTIDSLNLYALHTNDIDIVKLIMEECIKNSINPNLNTLNQAIRYNENIIRLIIRECNKVDIKPTIETLNNAIKFNKNIDVIGLIIPECNKVDIKPTIELLNFVIDKIKNLDIIRLILNTGVKPTIETLNYAINIIPFQKDIFMTILDECIKNNINPDITILEKSIKNKIDIDAIKIIIQRCKKINIKPDVDLLNYVIIYDSDNIDLINLLIEEDVKPNLKSLHFAISNNNINIISLLFNNGVKPTIETLNEYLSKKIDILKLIIGECKKINIKPTLETLNKCISSRNIHNINLIIIECKSVNIYPTIETLNISINTNDIDIIDLIIDECILKNIYPTIETLNLSINTNDIDIIHLIIQKCKLKNIYPTIETLNLSIKTNNIKIVSLIIQECKLNNIKPTIETLNLAIHIMSIDIDIIILLISSGELKIDKDVFMRFFYPPTRNNNINPYIKKYIKDQIYCSKTPSTALDFDICNKRIILDNNIIDYIKYIKYNDCDIFKNIFG